MYKEARVAGGAKIAKRIMRWKRTAALAVAAPMTLALACCLVLVPWTYAETEQTGAAQPVGSTARAVGTVKAISGNVITLSTDAGSTVGVTVLDSARVVRIAPGQKDLKDAAPIQLQDVQVGDRILARGTSSADGTGISAFSVVVMKQADVTAKQERERGDWQKRGVGGLVSTVAASDGTVVISTQATGEAKPVTVHVSKATIVRRYSPDSVRFDDAKPSTLDEIKAGDQLRARGTRSADGAELTAEEVVSGSFLNIAGTVLSSDAGSNSVTVMDLLTKKLVILKITADSQLLKLPLLVAQRIAARLRGETSSGGPGAAAPGGSSSSAPKSADAGNAGAGGSRAGPLDFQQMLKRMPTATLTDLQKGDAVMVVATQGTANTQPTAITLLSGVEPILSASPNGSRAAMLLSPWNIGGGGGDAAAGP
jgi:co-chaperonin GroES (HSP10)